MPVTLSPNEIRARAAKFAELYKNAEREEAEAQSFQTDFLHVLGIDRRRVAVFEKKVKCMDGGRGYIDLFWPGHILVEMKSRGKDRMAAYEQARRYALSLKPGEMPRLILICDFQTWDVYDLENGAACTTFTLEQLPEYIHLFHFLAGYERRQYVEEDPVNIKAAELMGELHDRLKAIGYTGHVLEVYLVRLLFCLFADDTGIFERDHFMNYLRDCTAEDGRDLAPLLAELFQVLNTPEEQRFCTRNGLLLALPYVNGGLFAEYLPMPAFDAGMRQILLDCCSLDWGKISPAIFGSMFQSVMKPEERRALGAHYTSERNILKLINPLFMDALREEFARICADRSTRRQKNLEEFHNKLAGLNFLDPACGCGNFLVIAYRELRQLELEVIRQLESSGQMFLDISELCKVSVDQFYGIEIEEFPAQIAQVAMWLMDHQMNIEVGRHFGRYFARIPLKASATIVCANALRIDWESIVPKEKLSYIMGNPPFAGTGTTSEEQKNDIKSIFANARVGYLDFVACWHMKAARIMNAAPHIKTAFVSTNSITQGEQVGTLWSQLRPLGVAVDFAWQTFKWNNEAKGVAAVHCIIMGLSCSDSKTAKLLYHLDSEGQPVIQTTPYINGYLIPGIDVLVTGLTKAMNAPRNILFGNKPTDGGHFILSEAERDELLTNDPSSAPYIRPFYGAQDYLHLITAKQVAERYCLWLKDMPLSEMITHPLIMQRVQRVREMRAASKAASTREYANKPHLFRQIAQNGDEACLLVPSTSSERREYIPIGFVPAGSIMSNSAYIIPDASLYDFAIVTSRMHMAWMKVVCGRLKSDYRYTRDLCYNTFCWPEGVPLSQKQKIESAAQEVLDVRSQYNDCSLATLYNPETMPYELLQAHRKLDAAVEKAYGRKFADDAERVAFLFEKYRELTEKLKKRPGVEG